MQSFYSSELPRFSLEPSKGNKENEMEMKEPRLELREEIDGWGGTSSVSRSIGSSSLVRSTWLTAMMSFDGQDLP